MDAFVIVIVLAIALFFFTNLQECCDFKILKTAPSSGSKLIEQNAGIFSVLECARMCTLTTSCALVQYCGNGGTCALFEKCANCTANFVSCSNGKPPLMVSLIQPAMSAVSPPTTTSAVSPPPTTSAVSPPPTPSYPETVCEVDKYLVTRPDGVEDSQLSESSVFCYAICPECLSARFARLNSTGGCGSWSPATSSSTDYIQVDFQTTKQTTGIVITGRAAPHENQYVTAFKVLYSLDCVSFTHVQDGSGNDRVFAGSSYDGEIVTRCFGQPIPARCIRISPTAYAFYPSLRFDVLGY